MLFLEQLGEPMEAWGHSWEYHMEHVDDHG